jgi:hypothetical protein
MNSNLEKEIICSYEAGDWFDKIPFANLCDGGVTAINVDRRFGKSTFIANAVEKILSQNMADMITIDCGYLSHAKYMDAAIKERLGDDYHKRYSQIEILPNEENIAIGCSDKRRTVTFIDEFQHTATNLDVCNILKSEIDADASTWIILGTSYEASTSMKEKNPFAGLLEMPFVRSYEIVGRIPEDCLAYYSDEKQQVIKKRQEAFPTVSFTSFN